MSEQAAIIYEHLSDMWCDADDANDAESKAILDDLMHTAWVYLEPEEQAELTKSLVNAGVDMTTCKVTRPDGSEVVTTGVQHHRWRRAIHEPRWGMSRTWLSLLGLLCIGSGVGSYYTAPKDSEVSL